MNWVGKRKATATSAATIKAVTAMMLSDARPGKRARMSSVSFHLPPGLPGPVKSIVKSLCATKRLK
jgi:hypothetical protein